jgi:hypothetical protein
MSAVHFSNELTTRLNSVRKELNMETAIVSYINNDTYTLVLVDSDMDGVFETGMVFPLEDTYCRDVYKFNQVMRYNHVGSMDNMLQHPVYQSVKLESYLAAPINDKTNNVLGTVNFTSLFTKEANFTDQEVKLVKNLAAYIQDNIELYISLTDEVAVTTND